MPSQPPTGEEQDTGFFLPYVRSRMKGMDDKWSSVKQLLRERESQLEMCMGNMVVFLDNATELLNWLNERLQLEALSATPPADLEQLRGFLEKIEVHYWGVIGLSVGYWLGDVFLATMYVGYYINNNWGQK